MLVQDLMTPNVISIGPDQSVAEAGELMTSRRIRHLPVVEDGRLLGLVTRTSLAAALPGLGLGPGLTRFEHNYLTANTSVREVMIRDPALGTGDMPAEEAARVMNVNRISSLIIVQDGDAVGIITDTDIFEAMLELLGARQPGVRLALHIPDRPGELAKVSGAIGAAGGNITALGGWPVREGTWGTVLKVQNLGADAVLSAVSGLPGVVVADIRG
ncbi:MAG: CBS domain-containing protein [Deltaproteobacteria bacterium]|nr:CBS domain-containing protein [Deltaproteobacteria bacterium]